MSSAEMVEHLVGMQGQTPQSPYLALWSRIEAFRPDELSRMIAEREAVRIPVMRTTIHLLTAEDALTIRPIMQPVLERGFRTGAPFGKKLAGLDLDAVIAAGRELVEAEPRTVAQLAEGLGERWPDRDPASLAQAVRYLLPVIQVPPRGLWGGRGRATWTTLESWLGHTLSPPTEADTELLILRYLAAFGPASAQDIQAWCWLTRLRDVVDRLRPQLRAFRDEHGVELFDVPDGPLPDADTPVPTRFLPDYDNILLSHADRTRMGSDEARLRAYAFSGRIPGTLLVDGFVRALWWLDRAPGAATIVVEPLEPLTATDAIGIEEEGARVLEFLAADRPTRDVVFQRT
jgi:winged helix DNA-binding protein